LEGIHLKEIITNLYVGDEYDFERNVSGRKEWAVIHACKEPYHRRLLGYTSQGAPKNHPEYLIARRGSILYLNIVDANSSAYIPKVIIDEAIIFIKKNIDLNIKTLVHCNKGESRSPIIAMLYLATIGYFNTDDFYTAESSFINLYPNYNPGTGMRNFAIEYFDLYKKRGI
jgi:predicted protein tyrosine phosphatase